MQVISKDKNIFAIIIAIEDYRYSDISSVSFAKNDALAFQKMFIEDFGADPANLIVWINEHATKTAMEEELPYHIRQLSKDDKFIFYYAGHGFHHNDSNRLTVWDSHKNNLYGTTVSLQEVLLNPLLHSSCTTNLIFIDSCSTYISDKLASRDLISSMNVKEFEEFSKPDNYHAIFCSCSPGEKSFPSKMLQHGIWTWHLIEALKGKQKDAIFKDVFITDSSLQNFLRKSVPDFITKQTTIKGTQTPFAKVSAPNTFTIRQLPPPSEEEIDYPKLQLDFNGMELKGREIEQVKRLSGFQKGYFIPDRVNRTGNDFIQKISAAEIKDEIQEIYESCKSILGLKRRDIVKEADEGGGSIETPFFRYYLDISQHDSDPGLAVINRRLIIRVSRSELPDDFDDIFPKQLDEIVIPIKGTLDFDDLVEKFENLEDTVGGSLKEDDSNGIIIFTSKEGITIKIETESNLMVIKPNTPLRCLGLIDFGTNSLKKITGQDLLLLP